MGLRVASLEFGVTGKRVGVLTISIFNSFVLCLVSGLRLLLAFNLGLITVYSTLTGLALPAWYSGRFAPGYYNSVLSGQKERPESRD